ncbi:hypothetical protein EYF80_046188 [Liparis tanakae]|uniref:Uncharacterized protein n=1 Tax=Liparis tanakae TaxID=230148 RepID=A0A4Z2FRR2_9TELE|nr:hypothetical protein EYF80_046188 [Liparis tanakae]
MDQLMAKVSFPDKGKQKGHGTYERNSKPFLRCTLSRELPLSLFFSEKLLPESVLMSEPRESAWRTELMLGVDDVPEMTPKTSLCKLVSRKVLDLGGVIIVLGGSESSLPF